MLWVVKKNEDGSYLIGNTKRNEKYWQTVSEAGVHALAMMNDIYGVSDNDIKPQGSLGNIASRYNARLRVAGLGNYVCVRVVSLRDNSIVTMDNIGRTITGIAVMPLAPEDGSPRRCFKVPEFVEIVRGMNWFFEDVYIPSSVKWIYREDESVRLSNFLPLRRSFPCKVTVNSTECIVAEEAFGNSTCTEVVFNGRCKLTLDQLSFNRAMYLRSIVLPEGLTHLGSRVFEFCHDLVHIHLPDSLMELDLSFIKNCPNLLDLWFPNGVYLKGVLHDTQKPLRCRVSLKGLVSAYKRRCIGTSSVDMLTSLSDVLRHFNCIVTTDSDELREYLSHFERVVKSVKGYTILDSERNQVVIIYEDDSRDFLGFPM